jgi:hypothetical protein
LNDALYTASSSSGRVPVGLRNGRTIAQIMREAMPALSSGGVGGIRRAPPNESDMSDALTSSTASRMN